MSALTSARVIRDHATGDVRRRGCLFYVKRTLKWLGIIVVAVVLLGVGYQTLAQ